MEKATNVAKEELNLYGAKQFYITLEKEWKFETLCELFSVMTNTQGIIFVNTKKTCEWLSEQMTSMGVFVTSIHSDQDKCKRESVMKEWSNGFLITTDVLTMDAQQTSLVINYDFPSNREVYNRRCGWCGYGKHGVFLSFITKEEESSLREIEEFYQTHVDEMPVDVAGIF